MPIPYWRYTNFWLGLLASTAVAKLETATLVASKTDLIEGELAQIYLLS